MHEGQRAPVTTERANSDRLPIRAEGLVKRFGDVEAVAGASFEVQRGEVFGLLGPNGAGKTTTIRILTTLLLPTAGVAEVAGYNVVTHPGEVRRRIGLVFQEPSLDESLTARENLFFHARLYGMDPADANARIDQMLDLVELSHRASHLVKTFSGGMRRRLEVARALLHRPTVLFLDEPTTGLDPQTRARIWEYVHELRTRQGTTVLMTTHYMDEAEHCDRIAIMDNGRIIAHDTPAQLKARIGGYVLTLRTPNPQGLSEELTAALQLSCRPLNDRVIIEHDNVTDLLPRLLEQWGPSITGMEFGPPTLEDVFLTLTGRSLRDEPA